MTYINEQILNIIVELIQPFNPYTKFVYINIRARNLYVVLVSLTYYFRFIILMDNANFSTLKTNTHTRLRRGSQHCICRTVAADRNALAQFVFTAFTK